MAAMAFQILECAAPVREREGTRMSATVLSINNYYYPRGGAEVAFLRHNGVLHDAGFRVVPFAMNHRMNIGGAERSEFASELEYGSDSDGPVTKLRKGLKSIYSFEARSKLGRLIERAPDRLLGIVGGNDDRH